MTETIETKDAFEKLPDSTIVVTHKGLAGQVGNFLGQDAFLAFAGSTYEYTWEGLQEIGEDSLTVLWRPSTVAEFVATETWKPIDGFPWYSVSSFGRVRNVDTGLILKGKKQQNGLTQYCLMKNGISHWRTAHHLVAGAFLGEDAVDFTVVHLDGDKNNNRVTNLRVNRAKRKRKAA